MRPYLSRRLVYILSLLVFAVFIVYATSTAGNVRSTIDREYFKHKEFLFHLRNLPPRMKEPASEGALLSILSKYGLKPQKAFRTESGLEIRLKDVAWNRIPSLLKELEERFEIVSFYAVDNTGKGVFEIRIVLK